jgi:hypothetical protein
MTVEHVTDFDDTARFGRKLIFLITNSIPRSRSRKPKLTALESG